MERYNLEGIYISGQKYEYNIIHDRNICEDCYWYINFSCFLLNDKLNSYIIDDCSQTFGSILRKV